MGSGWPNMVIRCYKLGEWSWQKNGVVTDLPNQIKHQVEVTLANRSVANQNKKQHLLWDKETKTGNKRVITIKHGMLMQSTSMGLKQCFFFLLQLEFQLNETSPAKVHLSPPLWSHSRTIGTWQEIPLGFRKIVQLSHSSLQVGESQRLFICLCENASDSRSITLLGNRHGSKWCSGETRLNSSSHTNIVDT